MVEVWACLDKEYGKLDLLAAKRIKELHSFKVSKNTVTNVEKFKELYEIWWEVGKDQNKIMLEESFKNPHTLKILQSKMPLFSL